MVLFLYTKKNANIIDVPYPIKFYLTLSCIFGALTINYLLTASLNALPALNAGLFEAGILIVSPV